MMKFEGDEKLKDNSKCSIFRARLKMCLLESDCCKNVSVYITSILVILV